MSYTKTLCLNDQRIDLVWKNNKKRIHFIWLLKYFFATLTYICLFILMALFGYYYYTFRHFKEFLSFVCFERRSIVYLCIFTFLTFFFCVPLLCLWKIRFIYFALNESRKLVFIGVWIIEKGGTKHVSLLNFDSIYIIPTRQIKEDFSLSLFLLRHRLEQTGLFTAVVLFIDIFVLMVVFVNIFLCASFLNTIWGSFL